MVAADARRDSGSRRSTRSTSDLHRVCGTVRLERGLCAPKPRGLDKIRQGLNMEGRRSAQVHRGKFNDGGTHQTPLKRLKSEVRRFLQS